MHVFADLCKSAGKLREHGGRDITTNLSTELNVIKILMTLANSLFHHHFPYERIHVNNTNKHIDHHFSHLVRPKKKKELKDNSSQGPIDSKPVFFMSLSSSFFNLIIRWPLPACTIFIY